MLGNMEATDESSDAVKLVVAGDARRSWPAGGSVRKEVSRRKSTLCETLARSSNTYHLQT